MRASSLGLLAVSLLVALGAGEIVLRMAGFRFDVAPEGIEFGAPDPVKLEARFVPDPDLLWVAEGYDAAVERLRSRGADLVFLGDSCTALGSYPALLVERLDAAYPTAGLRAMQLAVTGWSSYQGLRQLERDVAPARPGMASFYFGWNDHWVGFGIEDKQIHPLRVPGLPQLSQLRVVQLLSKALVVWRLRAGEGERPNRVSPPDFRENLRAMARISREHGILPIFITAPSSHQVGAEPEYLGERFLRDLDELVPLHQRYVGIVREVAAREGAVLCDAARDFAALPAQERARYFSRDGIHLRPAGDERLAELLFACLRASAPAREVLEARQRAGAAAPTARRGPASARPAGR